MTTEEEKRIKDFQEMSRFLAEHVTDIYRLSEQEKQVYLKTLDFICNTCKLFYEIKNKSEEGREHNNCVCVEIDELLLDLFEKVIKKEKTEEYE